MAASSYAQDIERTYADAEKEALKALRDALDKGNQKKAAWAKGKLQEIQNLRARVRDRAIGRINKKVDKDKINSAIKESYKQGMNRTEATLKSAGLPTPLEGHFLKVDRKRVQALTDDLYNRLDSTKLRVLRSTEDAYRDVIQKATRPEIVGTQNQRKTIQRALNDFADRGITGFTDSDNKQWSMKAYTEMATRTALNRSAIDGSIERMRGYDQTLAVVGTSSEPCPLCDPWEGRILDVSEDGSEDYPTVDEARAAGLFHPNCTHAISPYIEGHTEKPEPVEGGAEKYQERQQQRYNERQIRKWKKRQAACMTEEACEKAKNKIREWQKKQRQFLDKTGRRRKYRREQVADIDLPQGMKEGTTFDPEDLENTTEAEDYLIQNYNIDADFGDQDLEVVKDEMRKFEQVKEDFPGIADSIDELASKKRHSGVFDDPYRNNGIAYMKRYYVNQDNWGDEDQVWDRIEEHKSDWDTGTHGWDIKNPDPGGVFVHEQGHIVANTERLQQSMGLSGKESWDDLSIQQKHEWNSRMERADMFGLVEETKQELGYTDDISFQDDIANQLGEYALKDDHELYAQSFENYYCSGRTQPIAKTIVEKSQEKWSYGGESQQ
mgnify:CR=1 FL=1